MCLYVYECVKAKLHGIPVGTKNRLLRLHALLGLLEAIVVTQSNQFHKCLLEYRLVRNGADLRRRYIRLLLNSALILCHIVLF